jgi:hypothetical protein
LQCVHIDYASAFKLFQALASNIIVNKLVLSFNRNITPTGWVACFRVLLGSQTALEEIHFGSNGGIDDEGAYLLANLLSTHMSTVRLLDVQFNSLITTNGWRACPTPLIEVQT